MSKFIVIMQRMMAFTAPDREHAVQHLDKIAEGLDDDISLKLYEVEFDDDGDNEFGPPMVH